MKYKYIYEMADDEFCIIALTPGAEVDDDTVPYDVPAKYMDAQMYGIAQTLSSCCGVTELGSITFAYSHTLTHKQAAKIITEGLLKILEQSPDVRQPDAFEERVGKFLMSDVIGGTVDQFCRAAGWYCSPYPSINPKTGNKIMLYELGSKPKS